MEAIVADCRHGVALFPGDEGSTQEHHASIRRQCAAVGASGDVDRYLRVLRVGKDVDGPEMALMKTTCRIPRRVRIRFKSGAFE